MNETKKEISNKKEVNVDPEVVSKDEVKERINDWWGTNVLDTIESEWFRIQKVENHIEIIPVDVEKKKNQDKKEAVEKPELYVAKLGNIKYISTEEGVELLKQFQDMFDRMDRDEKQRQEYQRTVVEKKREEGRKGELVLLEELIEEIPGLTFYDGVILVREIFKRMIKEYLGDDEKDSHGCSYEAGLWDKMSDILDNNVLAQVQKHRAEDLHSLFEIRNSQYTI